MATTYELGTFDMSVLPGGLHKDARDLCQGAVAFGWKVIVKGMMIRLVAPDDQKVITISASNKNIPYEQYKRVLAKHGNPLFTGALETDEQIKAHADRVIQAENQAAERRAQKYLEQQAEKEAKRKARKAAEVSHGKPQVEVEVEAPDPMVEGMEDTPSDPKNLRYVVSESPMLAHRGQGKAYTSPTTNERVWSDGTRDWTCRSEGCDFAGDSRTSVGRHWRTHVAAGVEKPAPKPTDSYDVPPHEPAYDMSGYTPRRERVSALARVIAALDLEKMSAEELAEFVLNWQHEQSETGSRMAAEREELSSDDILGRIRSMLDNGTYLRQQEEINELKTEREALDSALTEALADFNEAKERWDTLRSLMDMDVKA